MGNAATVSLSLPERSPAARSVADIQTAAGRAAALVSQILAFTGHFWCEVKPLALSAEIEKLMPRIHEIVPESISVGYDLEPNLPLIQAGANELGQMIEALVCNSVEALNGREAGRIEVRTSRCELSRRDLDVLYTEAPLNAGAYVRLEVSDN